VWERRRGNFTERQTPGGERFLQASGQINGVLAMFNQSVNLPIQNGRWLDAMDDAQETAG